MDMESISERTGNSLVGSVEGRNKATLLKLIERLSGWKNELRERIELLLAPVKRKRRGGSKPLSQRTLLARILYKCLIESKGPCFLLATAQKALSTSSSSAGIKPEIFRPLLAEYWGKVGTDYGQHLAASLGALSKNQRLRPRKQPDGQGRSGGKMHLHMDGQNISLGVTLAGTEENSREMGAAVRHLCLDKGYVARQRRSLCKRI